MKHGETPQEKMTSDTVTERSFIGISKEAWNIRDTAQPNKMKLSQITKNNSRCDENLKGPP